MGGGGQTDRGTGEKGRALREVQEGGVGENEELGEEEGEHDRQRHRRCRGEDRGNGIDWTAVR